MLLHLRNKWNFLAEEGAAAVSNQALDRLLFGFDKGERSYRRQSAKRRLLNKSWIEGKNKQDSGKNNPESDRDDGFSSGNR